MPMNAVELLQRLHQHRAWVNGNLLTAAANLSDEQLRSPFQIGQGSIWKSLVHLYAAEYVWLEALLGNEDPLLPGDVPGKLPGNQQGEGGITGLDDLRQKWSALEQRWVGYLASLTPESLEEVVYKKAKLRPGEAVRNPPGRCPAARLHPRPLHGGAGRQHAPAGRRGQAAGDDADFPGPARGDVSRAILHGWNSVGCGECGSRTFTSPGGCGPARPAPSSAAA